ncbi:uncharacterized protein TEOVI_000180200 [Trypanosoma equiperdum]|uniref:Trypanosome variant surface glycoprotein (A-type) n=1 Tax=Trypanosoma equiperdum TaxID=5694 RepID=A0A1G4ID84_TRYEQ|nr:hypothetical protein TEOVI_000180200 [Trypanosoma equiperdum]
MKRLVLALCCSLIGKPAVGTKETPHVKGFDKACRLAIGMRKIGYFWTTVAEQIPGNIQQLQTTITNIKLMLFNEILEEDDNNSNALLYLSPKQEAAVENLKEQPPKLFIVALSGAAAKQLAETAGIFLTTITTARRAEACCMLATGSDVDPATAATIPNCKQGANLLLGQGEGTQTTKTDMGALSREFD